MALVRENLPALSKLEFANTVQLDRGERRLVQVNTWYVPPGPLLFVPLKVMLAPLSAMYWIVGAGSVYVNLSDGVKTEVPYPKMGAWTLAPGLLLMLSVSMTPD